MGMACTPCRRRRGCTCRPGRGGIGLQKDLHSSEASRRQAVLMCNCVECRAITAPKSLRAFANESPADRARTLFFDEAEAGAVAAEELQTTDTSSGAIQHSRLHGCSCRNDFARMEGSILSNCSYKHEHRKIRANRRAKEAVWINPIGSPVAADESLKRAATHLARYRDCARFARRYDRLHGKPLHPAAWDARCCYFRRVVKRDLGERG